MTTITTRLNTFKFSKNLQNEGKKTSLFYDLKKIKTPMKIIELKNLIKKNILEKYKLRPNQFKACLLLFPNDDRFEAFKLLVNHFNVKLSEPEIKEFTACLSRDTFFNNLSPFEQKKTLESLLVQQNEKKCISYLRQKNNKETTNDIKNKNSKQKGKKSSITPLVQNQAQKFLPTLESDTSNISKVQTLSEQVSDVIKNNQWTSFDCEEIAGLLEALNKCIDSGINALERGLANQLLQSLEDHLNNNTPKCNAFFLRENTYKRQLSLPTIDEEEPHESHGVSKRFELN